MTRLRDALRELSLNAPADLVLDLRADAYGVGAGLVANEAARLGLRFARFDISFSSPVLEATESSQATTGWLHLAHQHQALTLQAAVINSKSVPAGSAVSYGGYYTTHSPTSLALVAIGFADGLPRLNPVGGEVEARGERFPIAGRIAMDQLILDTGATVLEPGETVTIWGGLVGIEQWAQWSNRSVEVLSSGLGERLGHRVIEESL